MSAGPARSTCQGCQVEGFRAPIAASLFGLLVLRAFYKGRPFYFSLQSRMSGDAKSEPSTGVKAPTLRFQEGRLTISSYSEIRRFIARTNMSQNPELESPDHVLWAVGHFPTLRRQGRFSKGADFYLLPSLGTPREGVLHVMFHLRPKQRLSSCHSDRRKSFRAQGGCL